MIATLKDGMTLSIPVTILSCRDGSNVRVTAGNRVVLLDGEFLKRWADLIAEPTPPQEDLLMATVKKLQADIEEIRRVSLQAVEASKGKA